MKQRPFFQNIVLQSKDDSTDWRAFVHCIDKDDNEWELRGYGNNPGEAAEMAWDMYKDTEAWDYYGYITSSGRK
ncbi:MAG: hypothetical protein KJO64_07960 [Bacteroidia bacterium]|nr:hypothetical protein [Bacteroidia bacterium]